MSVCIPSPIAWSPSHAVRILDQTLLPTEEAYRDLDSVEAVAEAIRALRVRGAPPIGVAAASVKLVDDAWRRGRPPRPLQGSCASPSPRGCRRA